MYFFFFSPSNLRVSDSDDTRMEATVSQNSREENPTNAVQRVGTPKFDVGKLEYLHAIEPKLNDAIVSCRWVVESYVECYLIPSAKFAREPNSVRSQIGQV